MNIIIEEGTGVKWPSFRHEFNSRVSEIAKRAIRNATHCTDWYKSEFFESLNQHQMEI